MQSVLRGSTLRRMAAAMRARSISVFLPSFREAQQAADGSHIQPRLHGVGQAIQLRPQVIGDA